jgi:hypothetical protein
MLGEYDQTLIFKLACQYERLYDPMESTIDFFAAISREFSSATGAICSNLPEQLRRQEKQWRDIFGGPACSAPERRTESSYPAEMWASMWIRTAEEKVRVHEQRGRELKLAGDLRRAQRRAHDERRRAMFAQIEDIEYGRSDPVVTIATVDLTGDAPVDLTGGTPNGHLPLPRSAPVQRLPTTRLISPPRTKRTRSRSASRERKRRRSNTPLEDRAMEAMNTLAQPTTADESDESLNRPTEPIAKRLDTCDCLQSIAGVNERVAMLEQRFLMREEFMNRQMDQLLEVVQQSMVILQGTRKDMMSEVEYEGDNRQTWLN